MGSDESHFNVSAGSDGQSHRTVSRNHNPFWRERWAEAVSNRGPSAYQPNALPLGQTGSQLLPRIKGTLNCLSSLPILMQNHFGGKCSVRYAPPPPTPSPPLVVIFIDCSLTWFSPLLILMQNHVGGISVALDMPSPPPPTSTPITSSCGHL